MSKRKLGQKFSKKREHIHLWDLPKRYFPRATKSRDYLRDLIRTTSSLDDINRKVQYSAQVCAFNIQSIIQKGGFVPKPQEVFRELSEFVYHYENYCFRLYVYREKLLHFINAVIPIGYEDNDVRIQHILINPIVRQAGLLSLLSKFKQNSALSIMISERTALTHRLLYGIKFDHYFRPIVELDDKKAGQLEKFEKWCREWKNEITSRAQRTNKCGQIVSAINNTIARKIVDYKDSIN